MLAWTGSVFETCRRPGIWYGFEHILVSRQYGMAFQLSQKTKSVDNYLCTKGDALSSYLDFDLHSSIAQLQQCLQRTQVPAMFTPPTLFPAMAYPDT